MERADFNISWPAHFLGDSDAFLLAYKDIELSSPRITCDAAVRLQTPPPAVTEVGDSEEMFAVYVSCSHWSLVISFAFTFVFMYLQNVSNFCDSVNFKIKSQ